MNEPLKTCPSTEVSDASTEGGGQVLASRGRRLAGAVIDGLVMVVIFNALFVLVLKGLASLKEPLLSVIAILIGLRIRDIAVSSNVNRNSACVVASATRDTTCRILLIARNCF